MPHPRRVRLAFLTAASLALHVLSSTPALATTEVSISGTGVLRITTTGDIHFGTGGLALDQADFFVDQSFVLDPQGTGEPFVPDMTLLYQGIAGTTVLDFDDDVFLLGDFAFTGSIDFHARNIFVYGELVASELIRIGTSGTIDEIGCGNDSAVVIHSGSTSGGFITRICSPPPTELPIGPIGPIDVVGVTAVPEPGAVLVFAAGAVLIGARLRRTR